MKPTLKSTVCLGVIPFVLASCSGPVLRKESLKTVMAGVFEDEKCKTAAKENEGKKVDKNDSYECTRARIRKFIENSVQIKDSVTAFDELKRLGFDPKASNILSYPGSQGRKYILGTENIQIQLSYPKQMGEYLEEDNKYLTLVYPLLNTKKTTDRVYFSRKVTDRKGSSLDFVVILYNGVVKKSFYVGAENLDEKEVESAFGQGALDLLKGIREINPFKF